MLRELPKKYALKNPQANGNVIRRVIYNFPNLHSEGIREILQNEHSIPATHGQIREQRQNMKKLGLPLGRAEMPTPKDFMKDFKVSRRTLVTDRFARDAFLSKMYPYVHSIIRTITVGRADEENETIRTLDYLHRKIPQGNWETPQELRGFVYRNAVRTGLTALKRIKRLEVKKKSLGKKDFAWKQPGPRDVHEYTSALVGFDEILKGMHPDHRAVLLAHLEGYGPKEIAQELNISKGAVGKRLMRARDFIADALDIERTRLK